jgi:predicted DCC family thiol-disulfide oxidoreductase YuxK
MRAGDISESATTVFFDGSCPLCRAEINIYKSCDAIGALRLVDVAAPGAELPEGLDREKAKARFHVLSHDQTLLSGSPAFAEVWKQLPGWRWAGHLATQPGINAALELGYRLFLLARPALVRIFLVAQRVIHTSRERVR